jgi:dTDP-4-dehydrorhamnose 3,5-epimerase-like enzyme
MAYLINLKTCADERGSLTVLDDVEEKLPFKIKRIFYIYNVDDSRRGGHRHHKTVQAAVCIKGRCIIYNNDSTQEEEFVLDSPDKCLLLEARDWHEMYDFSQDAVLLVLASEKFDAGDYIYEKYQI